MWVENKVEKGIFLTKLKVVLTRTGVQRFGTRYVEINAVKDNFNFFYWMPFSNASSYAPFSLLHSQSRRGSI